MAYQNSPNSSDIDDQAVLQSAGNAVKLLSLVSEAGVVRVSDVSERLGIGLSTAHRLLTTLERLRYVEQDERRAYRVGPALEKIAKAADGWYRERLWAHMRPYLEELRDKVDETVHLLVLDGTEVEWIDAVQCKHPVRTFPRSGQKEPAYPTAAGQALLAALLARYPERIDEFFPDASPEDMRRKRYQLKKVDREGFAVNFGRSHKDLGAIGVVVYDEHDEPRAGIAVSGPLLRIRQKLKRDGDKTISKMQEVAAEARKGLSDDAHLPR